MAKDATGVPHRRRLRRIGACVALALAGIALASGASSSAAEPAAGRRGIDVVQVEGYFDPPNESLVEDAIAEANDRDSTLLVLQVTSSGAIDAGVRAIVREIDRSRVPVAVWVGPSGSNAKGATTLLLEAAHLAYITPASGAGPGQPVSLDDPDPTTSAEVAD
jgi:membrane-bound serine protease (ClpP class)